MNEFVVWGRLLYLFDFFFFFFFFFWRLVHSTDCYVVCYSSFSPFSFDWVYFIVIYSQFVFIVSNVDLRLPLFFFFDLEI